MGHMFRSDLKGNISGDDLPGDEDLNEFSQSNKTIGEKTQAADQGKNHYDGMGQFSIPQRTKPGNHPLRSCCNVGAAEPHGQVNHQEYLVKHRPEPGNKYAFQSIDKTQGYQPHGS